MGGYASFPVCFAAVILKIPFIIYENNLFMGKANRYLSPFAKKIFVSYRDIQGINKKYKDKIVIVGNIFKKENIINNSIINKNNRVLFLNLLILGGNKLVKILLNYCPIYLLSVKKNNINMKIYQQCLEEQKI